MEIITPTPPHYLIFVILKKTVKLFWVEIAITSNRKGSPTSWNIRFQRQTDRQTYQIFLRGLKSKGLSLYERGYRIFFPFLRFPHKYIANFSFPKISFISFFQLVIKIKETKEHFDQPQKLNDLRQYSTWWPRSLVNPNVKSVKQQTMNYRKLNSTKPLCK